MIPAVVRPSSVIVFILCLSGCARPQATLNSEADVDRLLDLMRQRLVIMHDVARWKWNARMAVADPAREQAVLADIMARSGQHGLDPVFVQTFFTAQFEAARRLQENDFRRWESEPPQPLAAVPDLTAQLRPEIDRINRELLAMLARVRARLDEEKTRAHVQRKATAILIGDGITREIREAAVGPLLGLPLRVTDSMHLD